MTKWIKSKNSTGFCIQSKFKSELHNLLYAWLQSSCLDFSCVSSLLGQMQIITPELQSYHEDSQSKVYRVQKYNREFQMTWFDLSSLMRYPCVIDVSTTLLWLLSLLVVAILLKIRTPKGHSQKSNNNSRGGHPGKAHSSDNSKQPLPLEGLRGAPPSVSRAGRCPEPKIFFPMFLPAGHHLLGRNCALEFSLDAPAVPRYIRL